MTIETPAEDPNQKKRDALAKAREVKKQKAAERAAAPKEAPAPIVVSERTARDLDAEFRPLSEEELKKLTPAEVDARRARLTAAIDALPAPVVSGAQPGTKMGEGLTQDYVPYTREWFLDVEARKQENPDYQLHEVIPSKWGFVKVNGVAFGYMPSKRCLLPTPHYLVYLENLAAPDKVAEEFKPPTNVQVQAGYMSPVHLMPGVWQYTPMPKE